MPCIGKDALLQVRSQGAPMLVKDEGFCDRSAGKRNQRLASRKSQAQKSRCFSAMRASRRRPESRPSARRAERCRLRKNLRGSDHRHGAQAHRTDASALKSCAAGDVRIVWRLDRLGRSLGHLIELLIGLAARGVQFRSLSESIDTTTPTGKLTFHVIGTLAEFERALIDERPAPG
jgi:Resolvase, N terminal domain